MEDMEDKKTTIRDKVTRNIYPYMCILGILLTAGFLFCSAHTAKRRNKESAYDTLELYGVRMEALLGSLFYKTDILESVIIANHGELDQQTFQNIAETLTEGDGIKAIQCLPEGIVTYCYPLEGNEVVIGDNLFEIPERREGALLALETKEIALSGPYELTQGGYGLAARNPIFMTDQEGGESFWGFSVVILELPEALKPLMLSELNRSGFEYQISCVVNEKKVMVAQSLTDDSGDSGRLLEKFEGARGEDFVEVDIKVPNNVWQIKIAPKHGWIDRRMLLFEGFIGLSFTILCSAIIFLLEKQGRQMEQFATTDDLTGLYNRRRLKEYMDIRCRDKKVMFALFYIDLNKFKRINDTLGHSCGDAVLAEAGRRIKSSIGKEGSVYRIGGDEFIALMEVEVTDENCRRQVERIEEELRMPFSYENQPLEISGSIGWAKFPKEGDNMDELMKKADQMMYRNKKKLR